MINLIASSNYSLLNLLAIADHRVIVLPNTLIVKIRVVGFSRESQKPFKAITRQLRSWLIVCYLMYLFIYHNDYSYI